MNKFLISLKKFLGIYKGEFEEVFAFTGNWNIIYNGTDVRYDEFSYFKILYNDYTGKYILKTSGYKPEAHTAYGEIFNLMRKLNEGLSYIEGGKIYSIKGKTDSLPNDKSVDELNETECETYLTIAIEKEEYELAEKIKKRLENFKS